MQPVALDASWNCTVLMRWAFERFLLMIHPFCPHLAEEIWKELGNKSAIFKESWPKFEEKALIRKSFELVLQVNGKLRARIKAPLGASKEELTEQAMENDRIKHYVEGKTVKKIIAVVDKLVNIVV